MASTEKTRLRAEGPLADAAWIQDLRVLPDGHLLVRTGDGGAESAIQLREPATLACLDAAPASPSRFGVRGWLAVGGALAGVDDDVVTVPSRDARWIIANPEHLVDDPAVVQASGRVPNDRRRPSPIGGVAVDDRHLLVVLSHWAHTGARFLALLALDEAGQARWRGPLVDPLGDTMKDWWTDGREVRAVGNRTGVSLRLELGSEGLRCDRGVPFPLEVRKVPALSADGRLVLDRDKEQLHLLEWGAATPTARISLTARQNLGRLRAPAARVQLFGNTLLAWSPDAIALADRVPGSPTLGATWTPDAVVVAPAPRTRARPSTYWAVAQAHRESVDRAMREGLDALARGEAGGGDADVMRSTLRRNGLRRVLVAYSRGEPIDRVVELGLELLCDRAPGLVGAGAVAPAGVEALRWLSLLVLCRPTREQATRFVDGYLLRWPGAETRVDPLQAALLAHLLPERAWAPARELVWPEVYGALWRALCPETADEARSDALQAFLAGWRRPMAGNLLGDVGFVHRNVPEFAGEWCLEAAAAVVVGGLDPSPVRDHPHFPSDLVAWATSRPGPGGSERA